MDRNLASHKPYSASRAPASSTSSAPRPSRKSSARSASGRMVASRSATVAIRSDSFTVHLVTIAREPAPRLTRGLRRLRGHDLPIATADDGDRGLDVTPLKPIVQVFAEVSHHTTNLQERRRTRPPPWLREQRSHARDIPMYCAAAASVSARALVSMVISEDACIVSRRLCSVAENTISVE